MFGKKKKAVEAKTEEAEEDDVPPPEAVDNDGEEGEEVEGEPIAKAPAAKGQGIVGLIITAAVVTLVAVGGGVVLGMKTSSSIEKTIADREAAKPVEDRPLSLKYSGDMVLKPIDAVVTNLASPTDTWIRLETAMVFKNGSIANPEVTAAELRQDMVAYVRTVTLAQLEGPSALQHLREDLNERASLRTNGAVAELIIQTLVVQ